MPTSVRSLAANWGQPLSAPAIPRGGYEAPPRGSRTSGVPTAQGDDRGAVRRSALYSKQRDQEIFGRAAQ